MTEDVARCVDGPVVARRRSLRLRWIGWILGEEKVATNAGAGSGLGEVGAITVIVQDHVAGVVVMHQDEMLHSSGSGQWRQEWLGEWLWLGWQQWSQ